MIEPEFIYAFKDRNQLDADTYCRAVLLFEKIFSDPKLRDVQRHALMIKKALDKISPLIQENTAGICPSCQEVCCISKHGFYNYEDLVYLFALGLKPPLIDFKRDDYDPCQFLTENGCSMERSLRPSGCNWYFCDPLLKAIEKRPDYREFDDSLRDLAELWMKMIDEFSIISPL